MPTGKKLLLLPKEVVRINWEDLGVEQRAQIQLTFERILYLPPLIRDSLSSPSKIQIG